MVAEQKGNCLGPKQSRYLGVYIRDDGSEECRFNCVKESLSDANIGGCQYKAETSKCYALFGKVLGADGDAEYTCWTYEWPGNRYFPNF